MKKRIGIGLLLVACLANVTVGQVREIVTKYLEANPGKWASPASDLVTQALGKAFPIVPKKQ